MGGSARFDKHRGEWRFSGITKLADAESADKRSRTDIKTIRADIKEAAEAEAAERRAGSALGGIGARG